MNGLAVYEAIECAFRWKGVGVEAFRRYIYDLDQANLLPRAIEEIVPASSKRGGKNALHIMAFRLSGFCREDNYGTGAALSYSEGFDLLARSASREALNLQEPAKRLRASAPGGRLGQRGRR